MAHLDRPYGDWPQVRPQLLPAPRRLPALLLLLLGRGGAAQAPACGPLASQTPRPLPSALCPLQAVTSVPADAMHLPAHGRIAPGLPANLVIFRGRRYSELLSRPQVGAAAPCAAGAAGLAVSLLPARPLPLALTRCRLPPALTLPQADRLVVRDGRAVRAVPPPYEELDYVPAAIKSGELHKRAGSHRG